ncbi:3704_t:CDS:2, partial [Dentiscutata heterogama]
VLSSLTEEPIQSLAPRKIRVKNFTGVREWKVLTPLEDLFKVASYRTLPVWNKDWKVRVQIASGSQGLSNPFNIAPTSGTHVGISFDNETFSQRLDYEKAEFVIICKYLDALFGSIICDSGQSLQKMHNLDITHSTLLPDGHIYLHSSLPLYPTQTSILGKNVYFKEYNRPSILDFDLRFDEKTNQIITELRMVWNCRNQDIYIIKENEQDKVELGVFGPQLDSEKFIGERIIIDENDNNPGTSNDDNRLTSGFFIKFVLFQFEHHTGSRLSSVIQDIVDTYQIDELFSDNVQVFGETDLENPVGVTSLKWGSVVLAKGHPVEQKDDRFEFSLPFRMRYQPVNSESSQRSHVVASAPWPLIVYACDNGRAPLFAPTPLPLSLLFSSTTEFKYILPPKEFLHRNIWPSEVVKIPVGQLDHLKFVERWSIFFALMGCAW